MIGMYFLRHDFAAVLFNDTGKSLACILSHNFCNSIDTFVIRNKIRG